jgi:hypothetical protein
MYLIVSDQVMFTKVMQAIKYEQRVGPILAHSVGTELYFLQGKEFQHREPIIK